MTVVEVGWIPRRSSRSAVIKVVSEVLYYLLPGPLHQCPAFIAESTGGIHEEELETNH